MPLTFFYIAITVITIALLWGIVMLIEIIRNHERDWSPKEWTLCISLIGTSILGIGFSTAIYDNVMLMQADYIMEKGKELREECGDMEKPGCAYKIKQGTRDSLYWEKKCYEIIGHK